MKKSLTILSSLILAILALGAFSGCTECDAGEAAEGRVLRHVVCLKYKDDVTAEQKADVIKDIYDLPNKIKELKYLELGEEVSVEGKNKGFTQVITMTFADEAGRDIYLPHPDHVALVDKVGPLLEDVLVVDYWSK
ncbi:Dabb family protein [Pelagicoccus mobilis]|uniref:Dabb family protein n=1 Tax=Pelagicoccus mobilis TaxID=415221 RepID=A0A934VQ51_9BACT|nr:Dabb family protein [Pelagicoccus mobilis]MBK1876203.1 Dabb family protein [Pelagicoccus mobilis]